MKEKILFTVIAILAIVPVYVVLTWPDSNPDETLDAYTIVEKAINAHGGRKSYASLETMTRTFTRYIPRVGEQSAKYQIHFPDRFHMTVYDKNGAIESVMIYRAPYAWSTDKDGRIREPTPEESSTISYMAEERLKEMDCLFLFQLPLRIKTIHYLQRTVVEDKTCHMLQEEISAYDVINYYFDTETFRLLKRERKALVKGEDRIEEEYYYDYKQVAGLWLPQRMVSFMNGQLMMKEHVTAVEINPELDENLFALPDEAGK